MQHHEFTAEASPDTLSGSFTPDLVTSKTWLCRQLKKQLGEGSAGDIYILGSWYGNMGIFLQQATIDFDRKTLEHRLRELAFLNSGVICVRRSRKVRGLRSFWAGKFSVICDFLQD